MDIEDLEWNEEDELYFTPRSRKLETKTCKVCGQHGLRWNDDTGRWRLVDSHGEQHQCHQLNPIEGFERIA